MLNPLILWDVGFQLSFMATLGLIVLVPPLARAIFNLLKRRLKTEQVGLTSELVIIFLAAMVVNTRPDSDHLGGMVSLLDRYRVERMLASDLVPFQGGFDKRSPYLLNNLG